MPIYLFRCRVCGYECEERRPVDKRNDLPPACAHGNYATDPDGYDYMTRVPAPSNFTLKGKGWAKDGYASKD